MAEILTKVNEEFKKRGIKGEIYQESTYRVTDKGKKALKES
jgi:predicted transcriptional regulator